MLTGNYCDVVGKGKDFDTALNPGYFLPWRLKLFFLRETQQKPIYDPKSLLSLPPGICMAHR